MSLFVNQTRHKYKINKKIEKKKREDFYSKLIFNLFAILQA